MVASYGCSNTRRLQIATFNIRTLRTEERDCELELAIRGITYTIGPKIVWWGTNGKKEIAIGLAIYSDQRPNRFLNSKDIIKDQIEEVFGIFERIAMLKLNL